MTLNTLTNLIMIHIQLQNQDLFFHKTIVTKSIYQMIASAIEELAYTIFTKFLRW